MCAPSSGRLVLFEMDDPLEPLFSRAPGGGLGAPDLAAADAAPFEAQQAALEAAREEVRRVLLGYDASGERTERLAAFLNAPLPDGLSETFRHELAAAREEICAFAERVEDLGLDSIWPSDHIVSRQPSLDVGRKVPGGENPRFACGH